MNERGVYLMGVHIHVGRVVLLSGGQCCGLHRRSSVVRHCRSGRGTSAGRLRRVRELLDGASALVGRHSAAAGVGRAVGPGRWVAHRTVVVLIEAAAASALALVAAATTVARARMANLLIVSRGLRIASSMGALCQPSGMRY